MYFFQGRRSRRVSRPEARTGDLRQELQSVVVQAEKVREGPARDDGGETADGTTNQADRTGEEDARYRFIFVNENALGYESLPQQLNSKDN